ncbi:MAG: ABC transporter permease [Clostridia bacterium]|nr:ABC transporter permease [Clostridia bacterium]
MNIFNILKKEILHTVKYPKTMVLMLLLPIVMMLILGYGLSGSFDTSKVFKDIKVIYSDEENSQLSAELIKFVKASGKLDISFVRTSKEQEGIDGVKDTKYSSYIKFEKDSGTIEIYKNERYADQANLVEAIAGSFIQRYNAAYQIAKVNPQILEKSDTGSSPVEVVSLGDKKKRRALDFYAVTMLTMIIMYTSVSSLWSIKSERTRKTADRIACTPVKGYEILIGKIIGLFSVTFFQFIVVVLFSKYVLKTYWGSHIWAVLVLMAVETIFAISFGVVFAYGTKDEGFLVNLLNLIIPFMVLLGGGFVPTDNFGSIMSALSNLSPLKWINQAIFQVIYTGSFSYMQSAILINLSLAGAFIIITSFALRKEAVK